MSDISPLARILSLGTLLVAEGFALSLSFDILTLSTVDNPWFAWLAHAGTALKFLLVVLIAIPIGLGPRVADHLTSMGSATRNRSWYLLVFHLLAFAAFFAWTDLFLGLDPSEKSLQLDATTHPLIAVTWICLGSLTAITWLSALAPLAFWRRFCAQEWPALTMVTVLGIAAISIALASTALWQPLSEFTFDACVFLLGLVYQDIYVDTTSFVIGAGDFLVNVGPECSGYEGIGLVTVFTTFYLSVYRNEFRFPHALVLIPLGIVIIWFLNVVRITLLIAIGNEVSPEIAIGGFHSQAGWIFFVIATYIILMTSHNWRFLRSVPIPSRLVINSTTALLIPLIALLAMTLLTNALSADFNWTYPLRVLVTGTVLILLWKHYNKTESWRLSWQPLLAGLVVFVIWLALVPQNPTADALFAQSLSQVAPLYAGLWLLFRVIGSVITVPLAEELAFRGYLLRRLGGQLVDNGATEPLRFSWLAFMGSSVAFGLLHQAWFAGILAGLVYGWIRYYRDRMSDAVFAHATTNFLLFIWAASSGQWSIW